MPTRHIQIYRAALISSFIVFTSLFYSVNAQVKKDEASDRFAFVATVNGVPISQTVFDTALKNAIERGSKDSPELRQAIKEEFINRALLAQEAKKLGLDKSAEFIEQVDLFEQNLLLQLYLDQHFQKNPITDSQLKVEYERQKKLIGDTGGEVQYRFSQIVTGKESEAMILISRLQKGDSFAQLAREFSVDTVTKKEGGSVGWINTSQMNTNVLQTLRLLNKNEFTKVPIQIGNAWVIVRLDDKRAMKIPTFEESKQQLRQAIIQQYLAETVRRLRQSAKIVM